MPVEVIAIFDVGKTNKKFMLFNDLLKVVHQEEEVFEDALHGVLLSCPHRSGHRV